MKHLSVILLTIFALSVISCNSSKSTVAQNNASAPSERNKPRPQNGGERDISAIYAQLNLNSIQEDLLVQIDSKYASKMKALRSSNSGERGGNRQEMQAIMAEKDAEIMKVLDADQFKKLKELTPEPTRNPTRNRPARN